ncbi:hypothetical protein JTM42_33310, partial [Pseudomonas aeruginosa]|nr:hypothetical protein [Pseudomonas aeruginosa]
RVQPVTSSPATVASTTSAYEPLDAWLSALRQAGAVQPDAVNVSVNNGAATAAAQYKASRVLVFLSAVDQQTTSVLQDKGWQVLDFSDASRWPQQFAAHADVFGSKE